MKMISAIRAAIGKERFICASQKMARNTLVEKMTEPIDFVVTWVDGSDPAWIAEKNKYEEIYLSPSERTANGEERSRDWETLKYWFRAVEKYAPWVRNVYLVTWGHVPEWLNLSATKLIHIKHSDFIPQKHLPTFNSNAIELNLFRIDNLSECFVYFDDDMFLARPVKPEDFFRGGKPVYTAIAEPVARNGNHPYDHMQYAICSTINKHFKGRISKLIENNSEKMVHRFGSLPN